MRVFHTHDAALDTHDAIRVVAELEDVAGKTFDGKVFVDAADRLVLGFQQNLVISRVWDRAAGSKCGEPRTAPAPQHVVDRVVMDQRSASASAGCEPVGQHADNRSEIVTRQIAIRPRATHPVVQRILRPVLRAHFRHDLLRQHIERLIRNGQPIELAAPDAIQQSCAFDQIVARQREQPSFGYTAHGMTRPSDTLQETRDGAWRTELTDQVHVTDIDAEFQRCGRHKRLQFAALQPLLRGQPVLLRHAAVMRRHCLFAQSLGQLPRHTFGHAARVDEHQCGAVRFDQPHQAVVNLLPDLCRHNRFQRRVGHLHYQFARALMAGVDDRHISRSGAAQQIRNLLDRVLRRRQTDAHQIVCAQRCQTFQRQRQMGATLVRSHGVDFVHDNCARGRQHGTARNGAEKDVKRFRRGDEDMGRAAAHALAFAGGRIAGAHPGADLDVREPALAELRSNAGKRHLQVALDVVGQCLQRRDIDHLGGVLELPIKRLADQPIDSPKESRERLARPGRRGNESVPICPNRRPSL